MRRTKFYDGFHEGIHNEIRERSQLETKFADKNRPEKPSKSTKISPKLTPFCIETFQYKKLTFRIAFIFLY